MRALKGLRGLRSVAATTKPAPGGGSAASTAGQPIGLLLALTKAS